ncbi:phage/plasmid primase, P4 family domain-containing protein [Lachnospiraceae bacterium 3-1]|nr:phage/plasmid primase, P4 family domain-containing protein [Lachnospiraceae bacterium 3-1]
MSTPSQIYERVPQEVLAQYPNLTNEYSFADTVMAKILSEFTLQNSVRVKGQKLKCPQDLPSLSIAVLIAARSDVALVSSGDKSQTDKKQNLTSEQRHSLPIGIYQTTGDNKGVYEITNDPYGAFGELVERYKPDATRREKLEVFTLVKSRLKVVEKCVIPYYVAVNNGIWDMKDKILHPFSQDLVFTSKIHTNLNLAATNPVITIPEDNSTWDVDTFLDELGSPEFVKSILEVIQAACLPLAPRNKMVLFMNTAGNNGKGTICQLIRNILGKDSVVSIPIANFSKQFELANLPHACSVICDENDVSSFSQGLGNLKSVITGDTVSIERKYKESFDYSFHGLVLQCVNDFPKGDDKSGSFRRRLHIIPFANCFTGKEKRYIKERLIYRTDVLEYILKMVLVDMEYREQFTETAATKKALESYVKTTNSVVSFLKEILPECKWDLLPATDFLYAAYKNWYREFVPSGKLIGRNDFIDSVREFVATDENMKLEWEWTDSTRSKGYIDCDKKEPLLDRYDLTAFMDDRSCVGYGNRGYVNREFVYEPRLKEKYSGLKRRSATGNNTGANGGDS